MMGGDSQVVLRPASADDMPATLELVRRAWHDEAGMDLRTSKLAAQVDGLGCLSRRTFMRIADIDGREAGFIAAADLRHPRTDWNLRQGAERARGALRHSERGRMILRWFAAFADCDARLIRDAELAGRRYQGEVALFIVDRDFRGHGVGRMLFDSAIDYFAGIGVEDFFLFTDTTCDFGFYEHRGLTRRCERVASVSSDGSRVPEPGDTRRISMFVYDDAVSRQLSLRG